MKIKNKTVIREQFIIAFNEAENTYKKTHRRSRLGAYAKEFCEENKKVAKDHDKRLKELQKPYEKELRQFIIESAVEKDGKLLRNATGGYEFSAANEKLVKEKQDDINEKLNVIVDDFLNEKIEIKVIDEVVTDKSKLQLPDNITAEAESALNGFVFILENEFVEEKTYETTEEEKTNAV